MKFNVIYNNSGPRTPTGGTDGQTVAGLSGLNVYVVSVPYVGQAAPQGNPDAAAVIQSNGDNIGNAILKSNPLPPGLTS